MAGLDEAITRLLQAAARGQLTPAEAKEIAAIVEGKRRMLEKDGSPVSGVTTETQSWNRYAYVQSDPVNWRQVKRLALIYAVSDF
jgi:hypothetical protein